MYSTTTRLKPVKSLQGTLVFNRFSLGDQPLIQGFIDESDPKSCEFNFANLYTWQYAYKLAWTIYDGRLLIYDGLSNAVFMPLGDDLTPENLVNLSLNLKQLGIKPDIELVSAQYVEKYPEIETYFHVKENRDAAEYIYDVNFLCDLKGSRLQKKKNLISQFVRKYPDYKVSSLADNNFTKALNLATGLLEKRKPAPTELDREFSAIKKSFTHFEQLGLKGLIVEVEEQIAAFSIFSRLNSSTYDIQFEKADPMFKGSAQVINHQTALFLKDKCQFLNREQDLGIKGLRQAKLSYEPVELFTPFILGFLPAN
ncbi:MAG: phosphatidylglycerol lysyltransferase domain-containing protein [Desulfobacula sp.]|nr:phosphatidylglycerol lysyltransferase domain-containing protein [Desulfobacula sp.]